MYLRIPQTNGEAVERDVEDDKIITLPNGLLGLPELKRFILLDDQVVAPYRWLQSLDVLDQMFVMVDPREIDKNYEVETSAEVDTRLNLDDPGEATTLVLVHLDLPEGSREVSDLEVTANLLAPIVINVRTRLAEQIMMNGPSERLRLPVQVPFAIRSLVKARS